MPSQMQIVSSRIKMTKTLTNIYPIQVVGLEDVKFDHYKKKWGNNFSTCEIGKSVLRRFIKERNLKLFEFRGYETKSLREKYGYKKSSCKSEDRFEAHCSDSLSLALEVSFGDRVEVGGFLVVDDTYRCVRRKLFDTKFKKGGIKDKYSRGTVFGVSKGKVIGTKRDRDWETVKGSY